MHAHVLHFDLKTNIYMYKSINKLAPPQFQVNGIRVVCDR